MKKIMMTAAVAVALVIALSAAAEDLPRYAEGNSGVIHGGGVGGAKAGRDTFLLMGGSGTGAPYIGDFEAGAKTWFGTLPLCSATTVNTGPDDWCQLDITQQTMSHWHRDTYYAVDGAWSAWCGDIGLPSCDGGAADPDGGYGNGWSDLLEWRAIVDDKFAGTTLNISALANISSEPGYDGTTLRVEKLGQGFVDLAYWEGVQAGIAITETATYLPGEYLGPGADEVAVVWRFESDSAWSDEDCSYPSSGGIQLDNILITSDNGVSTGYDPAGLVAATIDFEAANGHDVREFGPSFAERPQGGMGTRILAGVGAFASYWIQLPDLDPCATNTSRQVAFIDNGLAVPGSGPQFGQTWLYGPNGYIVNTQGGLAGPMEHLHNAIYSPGMTWPDPAHRGARLEFNVYRHEDMSADAPGMFYTWHVRSTDTGNVDDLLDAEERNRNFVQYGGPDYLHQVEVVSDLLVASPTHVQIRLAVYELGHIWGYIGNDGYPAPYFDNVRFLTHDMVGPGMSAREIDLANDGFPASGIIDMALPEALSVRFDMSQNISPRSHARRDFGDSVAFDCVPARPGSSLDGLPQLVYKVRTNPVFDPWRSDPTPYTGAVDCEEVICPSCVYLGRYAGDLPDTNWLFPGDVVHYFIAATDTAGGVAETSIMPADTTGFSDFVDPLAYDPSFTMHCLPTISDLAGTQAPIIFWNDFGDRGGRDEWYSSFRQLGLQRGLDFDTYYTNGPSSGVGNGLGGKATPQQLAGYECLLYTVGDLGVNTISNGDLDNDSGQDVQTVMAWLDLGDKGAYMTGDDLAADMFQSGLLTREFLSDYMNESFAITDVAPLLGGQVAPRVILDAAAGTPNPVFTSVTSWIAFGGCPVINIFDAVQAIDGPSNGAGLRLAEFTEAGSLNAPFDWSACTLATGIGGASTSALISMPYDFMFIRTDPNESVPFKSLAVTAARTRVLKDVLNAFGIGLPIVDPFPSGVPVGTVPLSMRTFPNPFNPKTTIGYVAPRAGHLSLKIYNVRGQLVRTLIDGVVKSGADRIEWDGSDNHGAKVASGVYFYEARLGGEVVVNKMALVK